MSLSTTEYGFVSSEQVRVKASAFGQPKKNGQPPKRSMRLQLPADIAVRLGDRVDGLAFEVELNDDGILFRPANGHTRSVALPAWVPSHSNGASTKK